NPEETRNITVPGGLRFISVTGLKAITPYIITLRGVIQGYRTKPLSVETMTGIFSSHSSSLMAPFLHRQGCEPELYPFPCPQLPHQSTHYQILYLIF
uniref:Fibronectin type-III domain-containing protein n=1 Tax=Strix occidentalis caurina TaxID=311401 RepID=A0A8D0FMR9_STROC